MRLFHDRLEAGHELARLLSFMKPDDPIVLGLANGGVPVAEVIAAALDAPLDVLIIERLSAPKNDKHIVGAVDEHGRISMIKSTARWHHLTSQQMVDPARDVFRKVRRQRGRVREILPEMEVTNRTVIIVSQGVVSGAKMLGAVASVRDRGARKVVVAAPAGSGEAAWQLHDAADLVVVPHRPSRFTTIGDLYQEFTPVTDDQVITIVERWVKNRPQQQLGVKTIIMKVTNDCGTLLCCEIDLPPGATRGSGPYPAVIFAHGLESDGRNPRTVPISRRLAKRGMIGVRFDFTGHGQSEGDIADATEERMARDLDIIVSNIANLHEVDAERIGLAGSGSGGALVMQLAAREPRIRTVVARGPMRGDELEFLQKLRAPTLLVYAQFDTEIAEAHRRGTHPIPSMHQVLEIQDATRLFADAISREMLFGASVDWLVDHLSPASRRPDGAVARSGWHGPSGNDDSEGEGG